LAQVAVVAVFVAQELLVQVILVVLAEMAVVAVVALIILAHRVLAEQAYFIFTTKEN
jgi:hypothetical protein